MYLFLHFRYLRLKHSWYPHTASAQEQRAKAYAPHKLQLEKPDERFQGILNAIVFVIPVSQREKKTRQINM